MAVVNPVPVTILTGFLGSGKTTLLNRLLVDPAMPPTAVVINEFGEVGLDGLLLGERGEDAVVLPNGCLCCVVRSDLALTLQDLAIRRAGQFEQLVIETSGLAHPGPVLRLLMDDPGLVARYRINGVVTLVDAIAGTTTLAAYDEARAQVALADRLLVTKADDRVPDAFAALRATLTEGSVAPIWTMPPTPAELFSLSLYDADTGTMQPQRWMPEAGSRHRHGDIGSVSLTLADPIAFDALRDWLETLARFRGADLLRVKGVVRLAGQPDTATAIHGVQGVFHPPVVIGPWRGGNDGGRIVLIGRELDAAALHASLALFTAQIPACDTNFEVR